MKSVCAAGAAERRTPGRSPGRTGRRRPARRPTARSGSCRRRLVVEAGSNGCSHASTRPSIVGRIAYSTRAPIAKSAEPDDDERDPVRRDVDEREEGAEEHDRRAEVLDDEQEQHRGAPHRQQRAEVLQRRERDPREAARADDEHLARVAQVGREEDDDRDLRELGGLERDRADVERQVRAVDGVAEPRQQQQDDPRERDAVAVALEHAVVLAQRDDRRREEDEPDDEPLRLLAREVLVEAVEHHEAEAREHRDEREEVRVGVRQRHPQDDVRGQAERRGRSARTSATGR